MIRTTFDKLREVKDKLPKGSSAVIAEELGLTADDVRDFFRGTASGDSGYHLEPGPNGGIVTLDNTRILEVALRIVWLKENGL
ncbi:MAG: DNA-binding protein [Paludibacteraceae bacterium]|nr:DNA-binding protein [Bacteroidales bacterium]MCQ2330455.1 DNA-binding protein [Paludibacteraceae bacterium]